VTRYHLVDSLKADGFTVAEACEIAEVGRSSYYDHKTAARPTVEAKLKSDLEMCRHIRRIFKLSGGTYGVRRVHVELVESGHRINVKRVSRLMKLLGLRAKQTRAPKTTIPAPGAGADDLVGGNFEPGEPDQRWAGDITYIPTGEGWLYLAGVLDLGSRRCIGWAMADHLRTELVLDALQMAIDTRGGKAPPEVCFHADRGCQYTSGEFAEFCEEAEILRSLGRTGICYDNAVVESFWSTLKVELDLEDGYVFPTRREAMLRIFQWIEGWYNNQRRHSTLDYKSPRQWEEQYLTTNTTTDKVNAA
jgi:transposase InsO family protein